jgi:hypothetical protein
MGRWPTMLQFAKCGAIVVLVDNSLCSVCRIRDGLEVFVEGRLLLSLVTFWNEVAMPLPQWYRLTLFYTFSHSVDQYATLRTCKNVSSRHCREYNIVILYYILNGPTVVETSWNVICTCAETTFRLTTKWTRPFKTPVKYSSLDYWQPRCAHQWY